MNINEIKLSFRMLKGQSQRLWVFIFCAAIGVCAHSAVSAFLKRVETTLSKESRTLLSADIEITGAVPLSNAQRAELSKTLPAGSRVQRSASFLTMAIAEPSRKSRLVEVQAVEDDYPFYGEMKVSGGQDIRHLQSSEPILFAQPELLTQLGASVGKKLKLGAASFTIRGIVEKEPGLGASPFSLGPKVYIALKHLSQTGLSEAGSRISHASLIALENTAETDQTASSIRALWNIPEEKGPYRESWRTESHLFVRTFRDKQLDLKRFFDRFEDYLRMAAFAVMIIAGVGVAVSVGGYAREQKRTAADLRCLGFTATSVVRIFLFQMAVIGLAASTAGAVAGGAAQNIMSAIFSRFVPLQVSFGLDWLTFIKSAGLGWSVSLFFALWSLLELHKAKPMTLFRDDEPGRILGRKRLAILGTVLFWTALLVESRSLKMAVSVGGTLFAGGLAIWLLGAFITKKLAQWKPRAGWGMRLALSNLGRKSFDSRRVMVSVAIPVLFLGVVSIYEQSMVDELRPGKDTSMRANLFLIDIQNDQAENLQKFMHDSNAQGLHLSPMIKARYRGLNGQEIKTAQPVTREGEQSERMRHREQNLSYRAQLSEDETIIKGRWLSDTAETECSLEEWYARRLGAKVGDRVTFDVQGVNIDAKVTSIRKVRWSGFRPNFFVLVTPSALADAPKTWVGAVSGLSPDQKESLQSGLAGAFPNITILDVSRSTEKVMNILSTLTKTVRMIALFALLAGWGVLVGMALSTIQQRKRDAVLLRILGAKKSDLLITTGAEFGIISSIAVFAASVLSIVCGWAIAVKMYGLDFSVPWIKGVSFGLVWVLVCVTTVLLALRPLFHAKPLESVRSL